MANTMRDFTVVDGNITITVFKESDYNNYLDYLKNGLKVIRRESRSFWFNDGSLLVDATIEGHSKKYVLLKRSKTYTSERYLRKYLMKL